MPGWVPVAGEAFLVPSGVGAGMHLFVVLNDPANFAAFGYRSSILYLVNVSLTTVRAGIPYDTACVVQTGEHPFIRHESYAYYRDMREYPADEIKAKIDSGAWPLQTPVSPPLLEKLRAGVAISKFASREHKKLLAHALKQGS